MKKSLPLLASLLLPLAGAAVMAQSCAGGNTGSNDGTGGDGTPTGTGGGNHGTGGRITNPGTGGQGVNPGSGGRTTAGTGGGVNPGGTGGQVVNPGGTGGQVVNPGGTGGAGTASCMAATTTGAMNGYIMGTAWKGYAFTATFGTMATISPVCDAAGTGPCFKNAGNQVCASGMVGPDTGSGALIGWNINQAMIAPNPVETAPTSGAGLTVSIAGATTSMRVSVVTMAGTEYCASMPAGGSGMIPWATFNTMCWNPSATGAMPFTAGTAIAKVNVLVPGGATATPFCFCIGSISGG